ncbi:MAG: hypothetical protein OXQ30_07315 [Boseongicola sp.]|nr:hypothetical protein [Boseongicola sp.]
MSRPNPLILLAIIAVSTVIMAGVAIRPGALMISAHEGDTYHLLDIIFRMDRGLEPHQDFVTPIGVLAFLPILWFIEGGYGVGTAILFSQLLVAVALIIPIWYTASSRLSARTGYLFAAVSMITVLALVYGGSEPGLSISMHYNRWAWAIAYILVVLALVPGRGFKWLDGLLFGLGLSALVLLKITFFVALLPGIALALILRRDAQTMLVAAVTGAVVAIGVTVFLGFGFWTGYVGDLANVAASEVRPYAGVTLTGLISEPSSMIAIALGLCAYLFLSRSGQRNAALALILLLPGFIYITYQNFGNDPKWLIPFAAAILALRPTEEEYQEQVTPLTVVALAAVVLILPSVLTMALSPFRHISQSAELYEPMLPALPKHSDIKVRIDRGNKMTALVLLYQR